MSAQPAEKMYPGAFEKGRVHLYYEFMIRAGEQGEQVTKELGIPWERDDYQPLPDWKPCPAFEKERTSEFDMYLVNYKVPQQGMSITEKSNQILQQLTNRHRDDDILMNPETAKKKGFSDEDGIVIENTVGVKAKARLRLTELVHPEVVACQGNSGRFARGLSGESSGVTFNDMIIFDQAHIDYVSTALDSCVRIKISKQSSSDA